MKSNRLTEMHCHILPGIDDGAADESATYWLLHTMYKQGIRNVIATSHYRKNLWECSSKSYEEAFQKALEIAKQISPDLHLYRGNELYVEDGFLADIMSGDVHLIGDSYILVEFDYEIAYTKLVEYLNHILENDMTPIIAHVEHYKCLRKMSRLRALKKAGCLLQVNTGFVLRKKDFWEKRYYMQIFKQQMVDFISSDCHDVKIRRCNFAQGTRELYKVFDHDYIDQILYVNPSMLLG